MGSAVIIGFVVYVVIRYGLWRRVFTILNDMDGRHYNSKCHVIKIIDGGLKS